MKKLAVLLLLLSAVAGCGSGRASYGDILIYRDQAFIGKETVPQDKYAHAERVGVVSVKTAPDRMPTDELSSNRLPEGTEIYRLDESRLLARVSEREYQLYERKK